MLTVGATWPSGFRECRCVRRRPGLRPPGVDADRHDHGPPPNEDGTVRERHPVHSPRPRRPPVANAHAPDAQNGCALGPAAPAEADVDVLAPDWAPRVTTTRAEPSPPRTERPHPSESAIRYTARPRDAL